METVYNAFVHSDFFGQFIVLLLLGVSVLIARRLHLFDPVIRRRFDPETGLNLYDF